jgi:hypothetical protein
MFALFLQVGTSSRLGTSAPRRWAHGDRAGGRRLALEPLLTFDAGGEDHEDNGDGEPDVNAKVEGGWADFRL